MQLSKLKKQLNTALRGHKMLKDKRDELMRRFLELVKEDMELRQVIEEKLKICNAGFAAAGAVMSSEMLDESLITTKQKLYAEATFNNIMSVNVPVFSAQKGSGDSAAVYPYGFASTSFELDEAINSLNDVSEDLIRLAGIEKACEMMSAEIEKTRRRVNSLEHVLIPRYSETIKYISMKLEENDRSSKARLMKVKDMLLEQAHHYSEH
jgi:V/A-type H+-transporting ATPase subunit D